ncbi:MAG TPA: zinc-dependent alcohol dehydrogenase family protein [Lacipirellulaceae bacterium]|jgi:alcohol dehydrogenase|nr:zinc-dependent alcohol dehydrogenase family protein [Lacipirellulaceae bacterium]
MQAVIYHDFDAEIQCANVDNPTPTRDGALIRVEATGLCRSDWHGWRGHDPDIKHFPHIPGHEFAGTVLEVGRDVPRSFVGQRVTMPFVAGCGSCRECRSGNPQVCDHQFQPGFTAWGTFAEYVAVRYAANNLVSIPESIPTSAAAAMGCRFGTAYRAMTAQGQIKPGDWVAIHGCGGLGLSAIMIGRALGARMIAVDVRPEPLAAATNLGAVVTLSASETPSIVAAIHDITRGGADVSLDALGSATTFTNSVLSLRKRGRHVQVGLLTDDKTVSVAALQRLIGWELEIAGSHGIQASAYSKMFDLIRAGQLDPTQLIERTLPLADAPRELMSLNEFRGAGVTIFTPAASKSYPSG